MFDDDEEEDEFLDDDDYEMSEMEEWFDDNYMYFKRDAQIPVDLTDEITYFYETVYCPVMSEIAPAIRKLMVKQYPTIDGELRPLVVEYIQETIDYAGHEFIMQLYMLVQDQLEGVNLREQYPKFEEWVKFYGRPPEVPVPDYTFFGEHNPMSVHLTDQQKKEIIDESFQEELESYLNEEKLKKDYFDILQSTVLKYYKDLNDLDYEGWIIYSVQIREDYEIYKYRCEHLDSFIEYELDEEDINLPYDEYSAKFSLKFNEKFDKEQAEIKKNQLEENL
ncbi:MAG: hypothetical protein WCG93_14055 [Paludibacter sp.]